MSHDPPSVPDISGMAAPGRGVRASHLRNHNERAVLTALSRAPLSGKKLAGMLGVSAQTASVITRNLEAAEMISRGKPQRGKVGKPQVPWALNPEGAYGIGLRIGRRGADFLLMDLEGDVRLRRDLRYAYPTPERIEAFLSSGIAAAQGALCERWPRVAGIGVAAPFELWNWRESFSEHSDKARAWEGYDFPRAFAAFTPLPVLVANDMNMACRGELLFGAGRELRDFAYFNIGAFVGGGVVLNGRVFEGARGNAGAFASLPMGVPGVGAGAAGEQKEGGRRQLAQWASLVLLEQTLAAVLGRAVNIGAQPELWLDHPVEVNAWLDTTAAALAQAAISVRAVLDVRHIVIDGGMPPEVLSQLLARIERCGAGLDQRGLNPASLVAGQCGAQAGALGAAHLPLLNAHFTE